MPFPFRRQMSTFGAFRDCLACKFNCKYITTNGLCYFEHGEKKCHIPFIDDTDIIAPTLMRSICARFNISIFDVEEALD